jgi:Na+/H+ antiporter NhaC
MKYVYYGVIAYLLMGFGFSIAAWLEAAEKEVKEGKEPTSFISSIMTLIFFMLFWFIIAAYCYKAEVKGSIRPIDYNSFRSKKSADE